jgi:hypothetical protein
MADLNSRFPVSSRRRYVTKHLPSREELIAREKQIAAGEEQIATEDDSKTEIPDLRLEDVREFREIENQNYPPDQLEERAEREDLVGRCAAGAMCEMVVAGKDVAFENPDAAHGKSAWVQLEPAIPKLSQLCGRKAQKRPKRRNEIRFLGEKPSNPAPCIVAAGNAKSAKTETVRARCWWVDRILWCEDCSWAGKLEVDDPKRPNWVLTGCCNVVRFRCADCHAEIEITGGEEFQYLTVGQLRERAKHGDPQAAPKLGSAIHRVIDWAVNAPSTTRGKVALAFLLGRFILEFFASSAWRLTGKRSCQLGRQWTAFFERALADKTVERRTRGGGTTPVLLREDELVKADYEDAKYRCLATRHILWPQALSMAQQVRAGLLSATDKALIEIYERGTALEYMEAVLLPRLENRYPDMETLKRGDTRLYKLYKGRDHKPEKKVAGALRSDYRNDWKRTVAPILRRTGRFRKAAKSPRSLDRAYQHAVSAAENDAILQDAKIVACKGHEWVEYAPGIPSYVCRPSHLKNPKALRNPRGECICLKCGKRERHDGVELERMLQINLERNDALESLDEAKIRAFAWKWHGRRLSEDRKVFWWQLAEAITLRPPRPQLSPSTDRRLRAKLAVELGEDWQLRCREKLKSRVRRSVNRIELAEVEMAGGES